MSAIPDEETIVEWFFSPDKAVRADTPERPHDDVVTDLNDSITLTMEYLAAATKPFDEGRPRLIEGRHDDEQTLFWSIYEVRTDQKMVIDDSVRTVTTILYYGFDAGGRLTLETVKSKSFEDQYHNRYSWPQVAQIDMDHLAKLLRKLEAFRATLVTS